MTFLKYAFKNDLDSPARTIEHRQLILKKKFLKKIYLDWYKLFLDEYKSLPAGKVVELGSGGGFLKELEPSIICSDVQDIPGNDLTFSALEMPFEDSELSGLFMIDTLHHIPDINLFLIEANRVLKKGAKVRMIEPANSAWGRFIYKNFHHEPFDPNGEWQIPCSGPMSGANGALPWIVFERDREKFEKLFPEFSIRNINYHSPLKYLLSGGISYRQLVPSFSYSIINGLDKFLARVSKQLSMFVDICIEKI